MIVFSDEISRTSRIARSTGQVAEFDGVELEPSQLPHRMARIARAIRGLSILGRPPWPTGPRRLLQQRPLGTDFDKRQATQRTRRAANGPGN